VTFFFSDVVGSTRLWAADPEAMSASLRVHDQVLSGTIARHGGYVFATAGDSYAAAFAKASAAVECAEDVQQGLADADWAGHPVLTVRIGMNLGEAEEREGKYFGPTVNQAARIMAVAHGGQSVLTDGVRDAAGVATTDLGIHILRDIEGAVHLSQLGDREFPPLWTVGAGIVSLPSPRTSLIGREASVDEVRHLVDARRLVTLAGVGGCGKTRLAIEVAHREVPTHPEGVWFVDLSTVADDAALPGALASALDLTISARDEPTDQIATYLSSREGLLVVDNCEHVIDRAAEVVDGLLRSCPHLRVLATSREPLGLEGELVWQVPSLATDDDAPAVRLFVERAEAAGCRVADDRTTTNIVTEIVARLDGIPLAIELAAARTRSMSITEIRNLLDDRFALLTGGSRLTRPRQATLEGAVQWSYNLLSDSEQAVLRTISVFRGGFSTSDVAAVCRLSDIATRDLVDALVAKSLVDVNRDAVGDVRHRLLETIRLFALARLIDSGEAADTRDLHLDHFAKEADQPSMDKWNRIDSVVRFGREYENFRAAVTWALERNRLDAAVRMAAMGTEAAASRGEIQLSIDILRQPSPLGPLDLGFAKTVLAWALVTQGDILGSLDAAEEALAIGRDHPGDFLVFALQVKGAITASLGDNVAGGDLYRRAQDLAESYDPNTRASCALFLMSDHCAFLRFDECIALGHESIRAAPHYGWRHNIEAYRAWALLAAGRVDEAERAVGAFTPVPPGSQWAHVNAVIGHAVMGHTDGPDEAARSLASNMRETVSRRPGIRSDVLQGFAYLAHRRGDRQRASEIVANTQPFGVAPIFSWLVLVPAGATPDDAEDHWVRLYRDDPAVDRLLRDAEHSERLIAEELGRWS
jgi:predicted ATPase